LGSNLGDRRGNIDAAVRAVAAMPGLRLRAIAQPVETDAVGPAGQPAYLNGALSVETTLEPRELLDALLEIERRLGRIRRERWGPRTIDLDIILYADRVVDEQGLHIPHPRMRERRFVLAPLAAIEPALIDPVTKRSVRELLSALPA
jgi:2-amino-4-hydroxy-6-hydroxymethyldihydropteridine diphosphokinase